MDINELSMFCTRTYVEKTDIEAKLKKGTALLFAKMKEGEVENVVSPFGKYYASHSTKYTYSPETTQLAVELAFPKSFHAIVPSLSEQSLTDVS